VRRVAERKTHLEAEDALEGGRCIGRRRRRRKAEEAEAEFEMERRGGRGFPLQSPPLLASIASMQVWRVSGDITVSMGLRSVIPSLLASLFGVPKEKNKNKINY